MSRNWAFYDASTGLFRPKRITCPDAFDISTKTPDGCIPIEGEYDHLSQRVDIETGDIVDYQPPLPDDDHDWNAEAKRWLKRAEVRQWERARDAAQTQLDALDLKKVRALSEHVLSPERAGRDGKLPRERLEEIEAQMEPLRAVIDAPKPQRQS